jgi:hypothetical protein
MGAPGPWFGTWDKAHLPLPTFRFPQKTCQLISLNPLQWKQRVKKESHRHGGFLCLEDNSAFGRLADLLIRDLLAH